LIIAWLGWVFDIFDSGIFNVTKIQLLTEMLGKDGYAKSGPEIEGIVQGLFLLGWSAGGLVFGIMADRWGRVRTLALTIAIYCACTGLTALCATWHEVAIARLLTGFGIGGEWAAGAALIAEVLPDRKRPFAAGVLQSAAAFGPLFVGIALKLSTTPAFISFGARLLHSPDGSTWRVMYLLGILPALVAVAARLSLKEPERAHIEPAPLRTVFTHPTWRRNAWLALAIGFSGIAGSGVVSFWLPNLVKEALPGMSDAEVTTQTVNAVYFFAAGTLAGVLVFPWLCERFGRKLPFGIFFVLAPISIVLVALIGRFGIGPLLWATPVATFFAIGSTAGFALYFPELFPSAIRATGAGFAYNTGRILTAPISYFTGWAIKQASNRAAMGVAVAAAVYIVGLVALPFAPETKGKPLPE